VIKRLDEPKAPKEPKEQREPKEAKEPQASKSAPKNILDTSIIENFNQTDEESSAQNLPKEKKEKVVINFDAILPEIKEGVTRLFKASCFEIDKIKDDPILFPIVVLIIMDVFLQIRMRICQSGWKKFMMDWKI